VLLRKKKILIELGKKERRITNESSLTIALEWWLGA